MSGMARAEMLREISNTEILMGNANAKLAVSLNLKNFQPNLSECRDRLKAGAA